MDIGAVIVGVQENARCCKSLSSNLSFTSPELRKAGAIRGVEFQQNVTDGRYNLT